MTEDQDPQFTISIDMAILAVVIANPLMFIFDILCIYLQKMKVNMDSAKQNSKLLGY